MPQEWFLRQNGKTYGPFTSESLKTHSTAGKILPTSQIAKSRNGPWHPATKVKGLNVTSAKPAANETATRQRRPENVDSPTLEDLQGEWKIVSCGQNGGKAPFFIPWLIKMTFVIDGDRFAKYAGKGLIETGRLELVAVSEYSHMDEHIESGNDAGKTHLGLIRWAGKKIEHLQGRAGDERPPGFPYTKTSMFGYAMMKRKR